METDCLFCKIVDGKIPFHLVNEDKNHLAILDIYPSVLGQTLVLPKKHYNSYVFAMPDRSYSGLMSFTRDTVAILDSRLRLVRTCMVVEGMEVDHAHIKLYPIHRVLNSVADGVADLNEYKGYITTLHGARMDDLQLQRVAEKIRAEIR